MVGIGFFAPFPLALMVPFMAGQSLAMGEAFGKGFQYGKRKISSMSNEEFNKLDFRELSESLATDYRVMIPSLVESIKASDRLQDAVFKALADVIKDIPSQILDFFGDVTGANNRASLDATTTSTSASSFGEITQVRAGSGLGDIRKQQEESLAQQKQTEEQRLEAIRRNTARVNQERRDAEARAKTALEAKLKREELALKAEVAKTGVVTSQQKRQAGQSQINQRNLLIQQISTISKQLSSNVSPTVKTGFKVRLRQFQAQLTILLQRYKF